MKQDTIEKPACVRASGISVSMPLPIRFQNLAWEKAYHELFIESTPWRDLGKIAAAKKAIFERLLELQVGSTNVMEMHALREAIDGLSAVRTVMDFLRRK